MPDGLLGIFRHQTLQFGLGLFVLEISRTGPGKDPGELRPSIGGAHVDDANASIRGFGGSMPNRRGGSPLSTQRQNFRSAVMIRC